MPSSLQTLDTAFPKIDDHQTTASFTINADGTLNGLPSGLQAVDLLVTIGV